MPFGLTNAPAVFQALINDVLRDMLNKFVFVYRDDILIFSRDLQQHVQQVRLILSFLLKNHLFVKPEKCEFHVREVSFLGFIISEGRIQMDPKKVQVVWDWPTPSSVKESFLGVCQFLSEVHPRIQLHHCPHHNPNSEEQNSFLLVS